MGKMTLKLYVFLFLGLFSMGAKCQEVALKSNLLYDVFCHAECGGGGRSCGQMDVGRVGQL